VALACLLTAPAASAATQRFSGRRAAHGTYAFAVAPLAGSRVTSAQLVRGRTRQRFPARAISAAVRRGVLRVHPRGGLRRCAHVRCRIVLRVHVADTVRQGASGPATSPPTVVAPGPCGFGSFGVGAWPGACWRPYSDSSPFNRELPPSVPVAANSSRVVARLMGWGNATVTNRLQTRGSDTTTDYEHPYYFSTPSDPLFTIHCVANYGGACADEGLQVRIPDAAKPANGPDGHMAVIDQASGWEYDFWQVKSKPQGGGRLDISWGGRTRIGTNDASGLSGGGTASGFGLLGGVIRGPELAAGDIPHALFMVVKCDSGQIVQPADGHGQACSAIGEQDADAPAMGQRFQLAMSDAQIDALGAAPAQRAVLRAMAHYGMLVGDTGGDPWDLEFESDNTYTSFGATPQVRAAFEGYGARRYTDGLYSSLNLAMPQVDWARYLRVVDPCFDAHTC
jgi:hypothetical protein